MSRDLTPRWNGTRRSKYALLGRTVLQYAEGNGILKEKGLEPLILNRRE